MVVWLKRKLKSTFEIEPSNPDFILRSSHANTYGRNSLTPHKYSIFSALPTPPPCSKFRTESCSPPSRKVGLILCYLSLLLNIGYAWHVDEIISNQWRHGSTDARAVGSFKNVKSLTYLSGK